MTNFYATIIVESQEELQEFKTDLSRNNIYVKVCSPEEETSEFGLRKIHYVLFGDDAGYSYLQSLIRKVPAEKITGTYLIESIEEGHE